MGREKLYNNPLEFYAWFMKYCKMEVQNTMLKQKRICCGLGNPPAPFYTNDVESQNNVIKHQTQHKAKELPKFVATIQTMIANQKEIVRAIAVNIRSLKSISIFKLKHELLSND